MHNYTQWALAVVVILTTLWVAWLEKPAQPSEQSAEDAPAEDEQAETPEAIEPEAISEYGAWLRWRSLQV
jgi:hypothetical protein